MRLFVALDLADGMRAELTGLIDEWKGFAPQGVRWVRPEGIHITLKFIGHIADEKLSEFRMALSKVHAGPSIDVQVRGAGFFPNAKRPRVLWCGISAGPDLKHLAADIEAAVEPLGMVRESREFTPHLTLARIAAAPQQLTRLSRAVTEIAQRDFGTIHATEFHLYESILQRSGSVYRKVDTYAFTKSAT